MDPIQQTLLILLHQVVLVVEVLVVRLILLLEILELQILVVVEVVFGIFLVHMYQVLVEVV